MTSRVATFAGKSSTVSRNADEGMDYGRQAIAKSLSKPVDSKVTDLSEYKAKKAETSKPAEVVDEDLNFGKSANNNVQSMDMAEKLGSKSSNVISMDVQAKAPIRGMEDSFQMKKVSGGEGIDYDAIGLPKQKQYELSVINSSVKNGSEVTANVGRVESSVDGIPSASGVSKGTSGVGKIATEGADKVDDVAKLKGKDVYGPHYDKAKQLASENPDFSPDPDTSSIVQGDELAKMRMEYDMASNQGLLPKGHHREGLAFGGENTADNIVFTGESTIKRSQLEGLDLSFYSQYGKPDAKVLKIHQTSPNGIYVFGNNPQHTEATKFQNKVLNWQRKVGLRKK